MMQVQVRPKGMDPFHRLYQTLVTQESASEDVRGLVTARQGCASDGRDLEPLRFLG